MFLSGGWGGEERKNQNKTQTKWLPLLSASFWGGRVAEEGEQKPKTKQKMRNNPIMTVF